MSKRRELIRMTEGETRSFIEGCKSLQVATINKNGTPQLTTLWFAIVGGAIIFDASGAHGGFTHIRFRLPQRKASSCVHQATTSLRYSLSAHHVVLASRWQLNS